MQAVTKGSSPNQSPKVGQLRAWHAKHSWWPANFIAVLVGVGFGIGSRFQPTNSAKRRSSIHVVSLSWYILSAVVLVPAWLYAALDQSQVVVAIVAAATLGALALPVISRPLAEIIVLAFATVVGLICRGLQFLLALLTYVALWLESLLASNPLRHAQRGQWFKYQNPTALHRQSAQVMTDVFWLRSQMQTPPAWSTFILLRLVIGVIRRLDWLQNSQRALVRMNYTLD